MNAGRPNGRRAALTVTALLAAGAFVVALRARALAAASDIRLAEEAALARSVSDLAELSTLRLQREVVADAKRPTNDVIAQVNAVLRDAGIATGRLKTLEPEADVPLAGRYRSQTIRLALERMTLPEVGAFLAAWRAAATVWTPCAIELTHVAAPEGASLGYDTRLVLSATYLADVTPEPSR